MTGVGLVGEGARAPDGEAVVESTVAMIILCGRVVWSGVRQVLTHLPDAADVDLLNARYPIISV